MHWFEVVTCLFPAFVQIATGGKLVRRLVASKHGGDDELSISASAAAQGSHSGPVQLVPALAGLFL